MERSQITPPRKLHNWLLAAASLMSLFVFLFHDVFMPFMVGFFFAYLLTPLVNRLCHYKLHRALSASLVMLLFVCGVVSVLLFLIPYVMNELAALTKNIPDYWHSLRHKIPLDKIQILRDMVDEQSFSKIQDTITGNFGKILGWGLSLFTNFFSSLLLVANLFSLLLITPLVTFYLLLDWPSIESFFKGVVPVSHKAWIESLVHDIKMTLGGFLKGQTVVCLILACYYVICLNLVGLQYAVTIGLMTGLLAFVPYLGFFLGFATALGVAVFQFGDASSIFKVLAIFGFAQIMESFFLTPKFVGHRIGLHPVWVIFVLLAGGAAAGFIGVLLAIPIAAVFAVILKKVLQIYKNHFVTPPTDSTGLKRKVNISKSKKGRKGS